MGTIALYDFHKGGHHLTYLKVFSKTLLEMGHRVMLFCRETDEVEKWLSVRCSKQVYQFCSFVAQEPKLFALPLVRQLPRPFIVLHQWKCASLAIKAAVAQTGYPPDLVFFPWLDSYFSDYIAHHFVDWIFPYPWSGIYFHPHYLRFGERRLPIISSPLTYYSIAQSPHCKSIGFLDEVEASKVQSSLRKPVVTFPDITDESPPDLSFSIIHQIRERAGNRTIVGLLGSLCKRKGLLTLLEVAQKLQHQDWFFVFAGHFSEHDLLPEEISKVRRHFYSNPSNCFFLLERIPDESQFNALVDTCDILFASYWNFPYSSNILTKAAVFEKPVIVSDGFCMSNRVKQFNLGVSIPERDNDKCIQALFYLRQQLHSNLCRLTPNFKGYRQSHSVEKLRIVFEEIVRT